MRVSTRGRYGLRAMLELARRFGEGPVPMSTIAKWQDLSRKHLHALLTALKSAGLVRSVRGSRGGFVLVRPPGAIRLGEILRAVEGPLSLVPCVADESACRKVDQCAARRVWQELGQAMADVLDAVTLEDMTEEDGEHPEEMGGKRGRRSRTKSGQMGRRSPPRSRRPQSKVGRK